MREHYTVKRVHVRNAVIRNLKSTGKTVAEIAEMFDLSICQIYRITNKKTHGDQS